MTQAVITSTDPIMERLEDQIAWYDRKSTFNQKAYKRIKVVEIFSAALIPLISGFSFPYHTVVTGTLGVLITVLEGLIHLNQYQKNWIAYRSTCEDLRPRSMSIWAMRLLITALLMLMLYWQSGSNRWSRRSTPNGRRYNPRTPRSRPSHVKPMMDFMPETK